jgi:NADH dehydrogenase [ubiquinone] 1 alpha subcomplex assembly factor 6
MPDAPPLSCEATVRNADFDRYLAALFAPALVRPHLFALYAFNYELAKTAETVSQPTLGLIRLQWWRDAIAELFAGHTRDHPTVRALGEAIIAHDLPRALFDELIAARENDLEESPFADIATLEAYANATSGHVMRLSLRILGADGSFDGTAGEAGIAYALSGLLRALPFHAAERRLTLPLALVGSADLAIEDIFAGRAGTNISKLIGTIAERARVHLRAASEPIPRRFLPALLPAALVPLYLKRMMVSGFDPFRDLTDVAVPRRQFAMLMAMTRGRI